MRHGLVEKRIRNFRVLVGAALADGELHPEEKKVLLEAAHDLGLVAELAEAVIEEMQAGGDASFSLPDSERERAYLFSMLVRVVAADARLHEGEVRFLKSVAPSFGFTEAQVEQIAAVAVADALYKREAAREPPGTRPG
jgi:uncharacterized tellurite resistance protein B-like protein